MPKKGKYQMFDALTPRLHDLLEKDIKVRGVMVPVELDDLGNILDGHNRVMIAEKHGKPWRDKAIVRTFETEEQKREHVIKLNLCRRQMTDVVWGRAFADLCEQRGVRIGKRGPKGQRAGTNSATFAELASECGTSERTARNRVAAARKCDTRGDKMKRATSPTKKTSPKTVRATNANADTDAWRNARQNLERKWDRVGNTQQINMLRWIWKHLSKAQRAAFLKWAAA